MCKRLTISAGFERDNTIDKILTCAGGKISKLGILFKNNSRTYMPDFSHLHVHSQYSLLDGAADITKMLAKAKADGMKAMALTDHGNMFGAFRFVAEANKMGVKPIVGCEFYVVADRTVQKFDKLNKDKRYHQLMLAKNPEGYNNLVKLCSLGYMEGMYGKWPRIDKELILKYNKGIIATSCCLGASIPQTILTEGEEAGERELRWWLDIFGEDYYIELQRHGLPEQEIVNSALLNYAKKYGIKTICSNDSHYIDQDDNEAHDILLCVNTGDVQSTPKATDDEYGKGYRFGFPNDQFYFKTQAEMRDLFSDVPESVDNTNEIVDKIEPLQLKRDILLPNFPTPPEFNDQYSYLEYLTIEGAKKRYGHYEGEVKTRLDFELFTIKTMGFSGYFLIVADFIREGRDRGIFVGPGRGSAAGSVVAYCIGITNIDPIKYNLLFERFLNPDRKSMPDIDTDFDFEGRQEVIDYVVDKYGKNNVAQIVTYGTMAAKSSLKDVARVLEFPRGEADALAKLVPERPGINLNRFLTAPLTGPGSLSEKEGLGGTEIANSEKLREIYSGNSPAKRVIKQALKLEGSVRQVGIHAAGIIIAPDDLTNLIPVCTSKESSLLITQYEGKIIEDAGVIKMDFLGLKTLSIIKNAVELVKQNHNVIIDVDNLPLDDEQTYLLYQRGRTNGTFQFESAGMQKYLRELVPDKFEDLIAMNALYRPGPIEYIPDFIKRKHGIEAIRYDLPDMEEYLAETYGITVYQEQVMLLSQKLAGFSKGDADVLRKAMGKKQIEVLNKMEQQFMEGGTGNGHPAAVLTKIWNDWKAFAQYAFNKSHSTCYAFVAYQTAYLKAHYPSEFMAAVLNMQNDAEKLSFFIQEARTMGINVLGPDVNESGQHFSVNKAGHIRFGLADIKGMLGKVIETLITERNANGAFSDLSNFVQRCDNRVITKRTMEHLVNSGALDVFGYHRAQYFHTEGERTTIDKLVRYSADYNSNKNSAQGSLFGLGSLAFIPEPTLPACEEWTALEKLKLENALIGIYLTGHPLDTYQLEMKKFTTHTVDDLKLVVNGGGTEEEDIKKFNELKGKQLRVGGMVSNVIKAFSKHGKPFTRFTLDDSKGEVELALFGEQHVKFESYIVPEQFVLITGRVEKRFSNSVDWEFKIDGIKLLSELRGDIKKINLLIPLERIDTTFIKRLEEAIAINVNSDGPKNTELSLEVLDKEKRITLELRAKNDKIYPDNAWLNFLDEINVKWI